MQRIHHFEFEDLPWFPRVLRDAMTDYLSVLAEVDQRTYEPFAARLAQAMAARGERELVDLCTGGGGPALAISKLIARAEGRPVQLTLTDLYPNVPRLVRLCSVAGEQVRYRPDSVDATQVPSALTGFRLLCNGFHHFRPEDARKILGNAVEQGRGIAIFEALDPAPLGSMQPLFLTLMMFVLMPLVRPFRLSRLLLTYLLPAAPLFLLHDGLVSWLRIYSEAELRALTASLPGSQAYTWDIGRLPIPGTPFKTSYLIGYPRPAGQFDAPE